MQFDFDIADFNFNFELEKFRWFVIPFMAGVVFLFATILYKYIKWFVGLTRDEKRLFWRSIPTKATWTSIKEVFNESLLHKKIWKTNTVLGYMHTSFALGWFLLILTGWIETQVYYHWQGVPLYVDIFFTYYEHPVFERAFNFSLIKDILLLLILIGVGMALFKRIRSRAMGMKRTTKHTTGDRVALSALWLIFPARLVAESMTSGIGILENGVGYGSFLTHSVGKFFETVLPPQVLVGAELPAWWIYSLALGTFFVAMPFSRYMHIFTEIPLIFLRNAGIRSKEKESSYDNFQTNACSRCGICIDPCQLQSAAGIKNVQSVYFLRDRRYGRLTDEVAGNCLMCGRCETACPVGIELNTLRLNSREGRTAPADPMRYSYIKGRDFSEGTGKVGYFAGCMTLLTPKILKAMDKIFTASGEDVWWADCDGGVCCGRPLKLSGEVAAARRMMDYNRDLFEKHGITTLVTSCPICLKVFREDYNLEGIEVLHHSQYIERLISEGRLKIVSTDAVYTYHDPCELGRGSGVYDEPRSVIASVGSLKEIDETGKNGLCCGSSIANTAITDDGQRRIGESVTAAFAATGAGSLVTACPLCKKALGRSGAMPVYDLAEVVAGAIGR